MLSIEGFNVEGEFPVILTATSQQNFSELLGTLTTHRDTLKQLLLKYGAIIFRGFPVNSAADFSRFIETLKLGNFVNYIGGDSPRDKVEGKVYTSTEAPPSMHIPLHQELSFMKHHPKHIYFYCETAPQNRGETIIGDARRIYHDIDPEVRTRFETKNLIYTSNYYYESRVMKWLNRWQRSHKSWIEVFETQDKRDVENKCVFNEFEWRWNKRDWLNITQKRPAIHIHPETNEKVWFNQAHLYDFNPRLLGGWSRYLMAKLFYHRKITRLHEIKHADGSRVNRNDLYHLLDVLERNTIATPWHKSDVMVLDNILTMHGRAPFAGPRRILTALTA